MPVTYGNETATPLVTWLDIAGAAGSTGVFASKANPFGRSVIITRAVLYVTTKSTGASTMDMGVGATAATASDLLIDGVNTGAAAGVFDNITNKGTNGLSTNLWPSSSFVTVKEDTGDVSGLVARLYLECLPY